MKTIKYIAGALALTAMIAAAFFAGLAPATYIILADTRDDRVDMVDLLHLILGLEKQVTSITIDSPREGTKITVLQDSPTAPLTIVADVDPTDASGKVVFGLDDSTTPTVLSTPVESNVPLIHVLDLAELAGQLTASHQLYAFEEDESTGELTLFNEVQIDVNEVIPSMADSNLDGIPNNFFDFNVVPEGGVYIGAVTSSQTFETKIVAVVDLTNSAKSVAPTGMAKQLGDNPVSIAIPTGGPTILVQAPSLSDLNEAGVDLGGGTRAVLLVEVAPDARTLLDTGEVAPQSNALAAFDTGIDGQLFASPFIQIAIIYTTGQDEFFEVDELTGGLFVRLAISNLEVPTDLLEGATILRFPSYVGGETGTAVSLTSLANPQPANAWEKITGSVFDPFSGTAEIFLNKFSIIALVDTQFAINAIDPIVGDPAGGNVALIGFEAGTLPVQADISSIEAAAAAFTVYFGDPFSAGSMASFDVGEVPIITNDSMYVRAPVHVQSEETTVDVWVFDNRSIGDFSVLPDAYTYAVLEVFPAEPVLGLGEILPLLITSTFDGDIDFTWTSDDESVVTVDSDGKLEAVGTETASTFVTVTGNGSGVSISIPVHINPTKLVLIDVIGFNSFAQGPLDGTNSVELRVSGLPGSNFDLAAAGASYKVSFGDKDAVFDPDPAIENVITADAMFVVAPAQTSAGFVDIFIEDLNTPDPGPTDNSELETDAYNYIDIGIIPPGPSVVVGDTLQLEATSNDDLDVAFLWSIDESDQDVASLSSSGVLTGISIGEATVKAEGLHSGISGFASVIVVPPTVKITITPSSASLTTGETIQLEASSTDVDDDSFIWETSDDEIADVTPLGGLVTAISTVEGTAIITATGSNSRVIGQATITVLGALPVIDSFSPLFGPPEGGTEITITGENLTDVLFVTVADIAVAGFAVPDASTTKSGTGTTLTITTDSAQLGTRGPIVVISLVGISNPSAQEFVYSNENPDGEPIIEGEGEEILEGEAETPSEGQPDGGAPPEEGGGEGTSVAVCAAPQIGAASPGLKPSDVAGDLALLFGACGVLALRRRRRHRA